MTSKSPGTFDSKLSLFPIMSITRADGWDVFFDERIPQKPFGNLILFSDIINKNVRLGYTEAVEGQSIVKLIVARLFRKLGNSIYQKWNNGQTMIVQGQTSKGGLILHVGSKGFQFCLFNYMMMYNNWWLLFDHENISKTFHLKHEKIVF